MKRGLAEYKSSLKPSSPRRFSTILATQTAGKKTHYVSACKSVIHEPAHNFLCPGASQIDRRHTLLMAHHSQTAARRWLQNLADAPGANRLKGPAASYFDEIGVAGWFIVSIVQQSRALMIYRTVTAGSTSAKRLPIPTSGSAASNCILASIPSIG